MTATLIRAYLLILPIVGICIHLSALFGNKIDSEPLWTDWLFLFLDSLVFVGLLHRSKLGYWFALIFWIQQTLFQGYWAINQEIQQFGVFGIQQIAGLVSVSAVLLLIWKKAIFLNEKWVI